MEVTCKNKEQKNGQRYDLYRSDLDGGCNGCHFLRTHKAKYWLDDWARCTCPKKVSYNDVMIITPAVEEKVRFKK